MSNKTEESLQFRVEVNVKLRLINKSENIKSKFSKSPISIDMVMTIEQNILQDELNLIKQANFSEINLRNRLHETEWRLLHIPKGADLVNDPLEVEYFDIGNRTRRNTGVPDGYRNQNIFRYGFTTFDDNGLKEELTYELNTFNEEFEIKFCKPEDEVKKTYTHRLLDHLELLLDATLLSLYSDTKEMLPNISKLIETPKYQGIKSHYEGNSLEQFIDDNRDAQSDYDELAIGCHSPIDFLSKLIGGTSIVKKGQEKYTGLDINFHLYINRNNTSWEKVNYLNKDESIYKKLTPKSKPLVFFE